MTQWFGQEQKSWDCGGELCFRCLSLYILEDSQPNGEIQHSSVLWQQNQFAKTKLAIAAVLEYCDTGACYE